MDRGTETGSIFPQGQILPEDIQQEDENPSPPQVTISNISDNEEEEESTNQDSKVISCLFNHGELKSVFNHDFAFNNTDLVTISRMDREAREEAQRLHEILLDSRKHYKYVKIV
jgi:hypothetical protein